MCSSISLDSKVEVFLSKTFINATCAVNLVDDFQLSKERIVTIASSYIYVPEPSWLTQIPAYVSAFGQSPGNNLFLKQMGDQQNL